MRKFWWIPTMLVILACGGGGNEALITDSPFAGQWQGTWNSAGLAQSGTSSVSIGTNGNAVGTTHNNQTNGDGTLTGTVTNAGQFTGVAQYPGQQATPMSGTMSLSLSGKTLTGNLVQLINGVNHATVFTLRRYPNTKGLAVEFRNSGSATIEMGMVGGLQSQAPGTVRTEQATRTWATENHTETFLMQANAPGGLAAVSIQINGLESHAENLNGILVTWDGTTLRAVTR